MQSVRARNTGPEIAVRSLLHKLGYRFRLHRKDLPGTPDIVFPSRKKAVFVHGCFWHGHDCSKGKLPKSRTDYWGAKITRNRERDSEVDSRMCQIGWTVLTVWQCELRDADALTKKLTEFLDK
jgi:DNA mismatch endonuclease (patch repair protein)